MENPEDMTVELTPLDGGDPDDTEGDETDTEGDGTEVSAGIVSVTAGVIYALRTEWAERYRILCVVPVLLHGISWVLWAVISTSGG